MNLNINAHLTSTIAADRLRAFALEAEVSRTRKAGWLARRAARAAVHTAASVTATTRPLVLRPVSFDGPAKGATVPASSDFEPASARVA